MVAIGGCGQNPSVKNEASPPRASENTTSAVSATPPAPAEAPAPAPAPAAAAVTELKATPEPAAPATEETEPTAKEEAPAAAEPTPPVIVVEVPGKDGNDGKDGKNGRDGKSGCSESELKSIRFEALAMPDSEMDSFAQLPLLSTKRHRVGKLTLGENSEGLKYVKDSMVFFKIPVTLPAAKIVRVKNATIHVMIEKSGRDKHPETEFITLLDEQISSGYRYTVKSWLPNNNPQYASEANRIFSDRILESIRRQTSGKLHKRGTYHLAVDISLNDLLQGSKFKSAKDFLYRNSAENAELNYTIPVVVADDSRVVSASIAVDYFQNTCADQKESN
jgi:hypothetical protein